MKPKYTINREMDFDDANDANIPVNIFLGPDDEANTTPGNPESNPRKWKLTADNFMPRRMGCSEGVYEFVSEDRQVLVDMVQKHWRPLYEVALRLLELKPDSKGEACLYYWEEEVEKS